MRNMRRAARLVCWAPSAQTYVLDNGRVERTSCFCLLGAQARVQGTGRPYLRSGRRASRTDVPFLLARRPDPRPGRWASRQTSRFCSPGAQTSILGAGLLVVQRVRPIL
ncbi:hypothetical protein Rs2_02865 [Raphanus sativus]|nr:hypothetical protein Rs2_02865 [Raphanus sativus]